MQTLEAEKHLENHSVHQSEQMKGQTKKESKSKKETRKVANSRIMRVEHSAIELKEPQKYSATD